MSSSPGPSESAPSTFATSTTPSASPATLSTTSAPATTTTSDGDPNSYPAMTTQWSTPLSCTWTYNVDQEYGQGTTGPIAWLDLEPVSDASTHSCYPEGMFYGGRTGTFSPGTCPNGWTTVSVRVNTNEPKTKATTTAVCCSSEYALHGDHCRREVSTALAVPLVYNTTETTHYVYSDTTTTLTEATLAVWTINALFQERDKDALGLTYEEEIRDEADGGGDGGLSLGARIGIGFGAALGGLFVIALLLFLLCRRHRSSKKEEADAAGDTRRCGMQSWANGSDLPAPAYEFSERNSIAEDEDDDSIRDGEIEALRAQKAAIQRRIEELQRVEAAENVQER